MKRAAKKMKVENRLQRIGSSIEPPIGTPPSSESPKTERRLSPNRHSFFPSSEFQFKIDLITKAELEEVMLVWAMKQGWEHSLEDVDTYFNSGANIYALRKMNNYGEYELAGCILLCLDKQRNGESFYSVGLFITNEKYRGQKMVGPMLWQFIQNITAGKTLSLNSVPRVIGFYQKQGFDETNISSLQFRLNTTTQFHMSSGTRLLEGQKTLRKMIGNDQNSPEFVDKITGYQQKVFCNNVDENNKFTRLFMERADAIAVMYYSNNKVEGFGILTCRKREANVAHYRMSPVQADSLDVGSKIIHCLLSTVKFPTSFTIDIPLNKTNIEYGNAIQNMLNALGFKSIAESGSILMTTDKKSVSHVVTPPEVIGLEPLECPHPAIRQLYS